MASEDDHQDDRMVFGFTFENNCIIKDDLHALPHGYNHVSFFYQAHDVVYMIQIVCVEMCQFTLYGSSPVLSSHCDIPNK